MVADSELDDCVPVPELDGFEETAIRFVGGTRDVVVIVSGGRLGRFEDMVKRGSLSRSLCR